MPDCSTNLFIADFKKACLNNNYYFARERNKNINFLLKLGWTVEDMINFLYNNLSVEHYYKGPELENNPNYNSGIIFVFIITIEEFSLSAYLKIKKVDDSNKFVIISFHEEGDN